MVPFKFSHLRVLAFVGLAVLASSMPVFAQTLAWNANTESNVAGYRIQYGTVSNNPTATLDVGRVTSRQMTGLQAGATYYFRVVAYNTAGQTSAPSAQVAYTVPGTPPTTAPTLTAVSPTSGPTSGGTTITLTGTNFAAGATVRVGGAAATSVTFSSSTRITARTPAGTAGARDVIVTNPNGRSASRAGAFTYVSSPPPSSSLTLASVSPASGPTSGGTVITVTGSGFVSGARVSIGTLVAQNVVFVSSTQLRATTPYSGTSGARDVRVTNPTGQYVIRAGAFTYGTSTPTPPPPTSSSLTLTSVSPASGPTSGGTVITVTGSGFVSGARVSIGTLVARNVVFVSSTQLRATTPMATAGRRDVRVTNPNGRYVIRAGAFTYGTSTSTPPPPTSSSLTLTSVSPASGPTSGGTVITVTGSGFVSGARVSIGTLVGQNVVFVSSTQLRATTPMATAGTRDVRVTNPNGQYVIRAGAFTYGTSAPSTGTRPTVTSVSPASGPRSGGTTITVSGSGFVSGARVSIGTLVASNVVFVSSTQLRARTPYSSTTGPRDVRVTNPNSAYGIRSGGFTYTSTSTSSSTLTSASATAETLSSEGAAVDGGAVMAAETLSAETLSAETLSTGSDTVEGVLGDTVGDAAGDVDGDGLPSDWESRFGLDAASDAGADGAAGDPDGDGVSNDAELAAGSHPRGLIRRYLAEGIENAQTHTRLALANPEATDAHVLLTFMRADGTMVRRPVDVPARSRRTIDLGTEPELAGSSFSTVLESDGLVALDRVVAFGPDGRTTSVATAVDEPSSAWSLPSASTAGPFELFYLVLNPGEADTQVQVRYALPDGAAPVERTHSVPAHSRATIWVDREAPSLAAAEVAAEITTPDGSPIVVERTHYVTEAGSAVPRSAATDAGHGAADAARDAAPRPVARWLLAEGDSAGGATTLAIANRGASTDVKVTLLFEDGAEAVRSFPAAADARIEVPLARSFPAAADRRFSVLVEAVDPAADLVVDRAATRQVVDDGTRTVGAEGSGTRLP